MLNSGKCKINTDPFAFHYRFNSGKRANAITELRRSSFSKYSPVLCHKLIYEIGICHSINVETCDKTSFKVSQTVNLSGLVPVFQF